MRICSREVQRSSYGVHMNYVSTSYVVHTKFTSNGICMKFMLDSYELIMKFVGIYMHYTQKTTMGFDVKAYHDNGSHAAFIRNAYLIPIKLIWNTCAVHSKFIWTSVIYDSIQPHKNTYSVLVQNRYIWTLYEGNDLKIFKTFEPHTLKMSW